MEIRKRNSYVYFIIFGTGNFYEGTFFSLLTLE